MVLSLTELCFRSVCQSSRLDGDKALECYLKLDLSQSKCSLFSKIFGKRPKGSGRCLSIPSNVRRGASINPFKTVKLCHWFHYLKNKDQVKVRNLFMKKPAGEKKRCKALLVKAVEHLIKSSSKGAAVVEIEEGYSIANMVGFDLLSNEGYSSSNETNNENEEEEDSLFGDDSSDDDDDDSDVVEHVGIGSRHDQVEAFVEERLAKRRKSKARRRPDSTTVNVLPVESSSSTSSVPPPVRNPKSPESPAMDCVGIDTDSGKSISTLRKDFMFLDTGVSARNSVEIRGIGGAGAYRIGGRGPMIIRVLTHTGEEVQLVDPEGVYLQKTAPSPDFRVLGQQRMKSFGCRLVQCYNDTEMDVIECMRTKTIVPLATKNGILVVRTYGPFTPVSKEVCLDIVNKSSSALISLNEKTPATSMVMNTARLSNEALARLWHWRLGHPAPEVPLKMQQGVDFRLNEDCYCCDKSKFKVGSFPRRDPVLLQNNPPFWRVYCDAYGGGTREQLAGTSMGGESYEGAVGGYVFTDPTTGTMRRKLYATKEQFPAILFQYLQDVERQHFKCREVYVDTHIINISTAVEDVAAMFLCKVCPISAGTPQELAFAESAVRILGKISRSLLLGAPHLPQWAWGLADGYATYVHDVLPQRSKGNKSPFELRVGRAPDCDALFIKTEGLLVYNMLTSISATYI